MKGAAITATPAMAMSFTGNPRMSGGLRRYRKVSDIEARAIVTLSVFQGLAQNLQDISRKLGKLIQKQHTVMSHADFAGPRDRAAADKSGI
jgi:hypothetical protein